MTTNRSSPIDPTATDLVWNDFIRVTNLLVFRDWARRQSDPQVCAHTVLKYHRERVMNEVVKESTKYLIEAAESEDEEVIKEAKRDTSEYERQIKDALDVLGTAVMSAVMANSDSIIFKRLDEHESDKAPE